MSLTPIDFEDNLEDFLDGDGAPLDVDIVSNTTNPRPWTLLNMMRSVLQALYSRARGAALSVWVRASNTEGPLTNVAASVDGHVLRRSGTALGFGTVPTAGLTDAAVTLAKMENRAAARLIGRRAGSSGVPEEVDCGTGIEISASARLQMVNMAARSVKARAANSSGAPADLAGAGTAAAPQVLTDNGTSLAFRNLAPADVSAANVIYEVDFSGLANNTFADGNETIDGLTWTAANSVELATFDISNTNGLRAVNATSNGGASTMTSSSQLAPYIYTTLAQIPGFDPQYDYIFEIYCSSITHEQNGEGVMLGLWDVAASPMTTSVARLRAGAIVNGTSFDRVIRSTVTTTNNEGTDDRTGHNVLSVRINAQGMTSIASGTWGSTWPALSGGLHIPTTSATVDPFNNGACRLFLAFPVANDASPTTSTTIQRLRVRRV